MMTRIAMMLAATAALAGGCHNDGLPNEGEQPPGGGKQDMQPAPDMQPVLHCGRTTAPPADAFERLKFGVVANWRGTVTTPWTAPYQVEIAFAADGTYSAKTTDASGQLPFYYDKDPEHDRYELLDMQANGKASGNLYLEWLSSPDQLQQIALDADMTHLAFDYFHFGAGPVHYDLGCTP